MLPSLTMLGFQIECPMLTASGSLTGVPQPLPRRSTRHKLAIFGRTDTYTAYEPSGENSDDQSFHVRSFAGPEMMPGSNTWAAGSGSRRPELMPRARLGGASNGQVERHVRYLTPAF